MKNELALEQLRLVSLGALRYEDADRIGMRKICEYGNLDRNGEYRMCIVEFYAAHGTADNPVLARVPLSISAWDNTLPNSPTNGFISFPLSV